MQCSALTGIRVVEVGGGLAGPFAGKLLAEMGAEVWKIEPPGAGDPSRGYGPFPGDRIDREKSGIFHYLNAGKKSVVIDLESARGQAAVQRLSRAADALVVAGDVRTIESRRLTHADIAGQAPRAIVTTITPFGFASALRYANACDLTICALGGVTTAVGERDRQPLTPPLELSDYQAGIAAASATLLALFAREANGVGQHVDTSPLDVWATVHQGSGVFNYIHFGRSTARAGRRRREAYPFNFIEAKDGAICMIAREAKQWQRFIELVGEPALLSNPRYQDRVTMGLQYPAEVDALLAPWFAARTRDEIFALCRANHIPYAPVRRIDEVTECAQLAERGFFVDLPAGASGVSFRVPGAPYRMSGTPARVSGPAPGLGEHTREVLAGAGFTHAEIDLL